jgi:hypothetical protein
MRITNRRSAAIAGAATLLSVLALGAAALPASADTASSYTQTVHQTWDLSNTSLGLTNPCTNDPLSGNARTNLLNHVNVQGDNLWATFTETDKIVATDAGTGETFSGEFTIWGGFNLNEQNSNSTFTASGQLQGDQGDTIGYHEVAHSTLTPGDQLTVSFDNPTLTCGS